MDIVYQDHAKHRNQMQQNPPMKTNDMYMPAEHMYQQPGQERHAVNAKPLSYLGKVIDPNLEDGEDGMPVAVYKMPPMEVNTALADARGGGGFSGMPKV